MGIDPNVLMLPGVKIAFGIANANDTNILNISEAIDLLDFEVLYTRTDWRDTNIYARLKKVEKMEILVPNFVPLEMIKVVF